MKCQHAPNAHATIKWNDDIVLARTYNIWSSHAMLVKYKEHHYFEQCGSLLQTCKYHMIFSA